MNKKGNVINRFMTEKGVSEMTCEEYFPFKSQEWIEKRDKNKRGGVGSKHIKNLKQISTNDPYGE